jgi:hypothetical protein
VKHALLAVALLLPATAEARCYSICKYPWKQHCGLRQTSPKLARLRQTSPDFAKPRQSAPEIPLPSLDGDWGEVGPERLKGIGLLRELSYASEVRRP